MEAADLPQRYQAQIAAKRGEPMSRPVPAPAARKRAKVGESDLEVSFRRQAKTAGIDKGMIQEYRFHPVRKWRMDFAWPDRKVALEIDGGTWSSGGHVRGAYYEETCVKLNEAALASWQVYRVTNHMVEDGRALATIEAALKKGR
jgi:very-short-patch-repair endonuclease